MIRILLVEDEATLAMIVSETLSSEGFEVTQAADGVEGLRMATSQAFDVLVVDIMMPHMDGFQMVRRLRQNGNATPVLFLTARSSVSDVVEGFEIGGNDYLRKPFSMQELIVRIKNLMRLSHSADRDAAAIRSSVPDAISIGQYVLNPVSQMLTLDDESVELSHRESELLHLLAKNKEHVVETTYILISLWGDDSTYNAKSLQVFITKLRHKLAADVNIKIINVRGIGYKLVC